MWLFYLVLGFFLVAFPAGAGSSANGQTSQEAGIPATVPLVAATEKTATAQVDEDEDEVVYNAGVISGILGSDITVQLRTPGSVKQGQRALFFSNVATYGESIVDEIGHLEPTREGLAALRRQIQESQSRASEEQLQKRIEQADLIVTGKVSATRPTPETQQRPPVSEHDPQWWEATVKVQSVEKGRPPKGDVILLFPHSDDVRWFASPKFKEGQQGVFLLHRSEYASLRGRGYTALRALDFQPMEQREHLKKLIQAAH